MDQVRWVLFSISVFLIAGSQEKLFKNDDLMVSWQEEGGGNVHIMGSWMKTNKNTTFASFQGIPYAEPPVLQSRFLRPNKFQYNSSLTEIDARGTFQTVCPQPGYFISMSEDCLYLNIYAAENIEVLKPVMVWIHGGAFFGGDGTWDSFGPQHFLDQDVVMVTLNYRLGALGFLSLGNSEVPGNMGLWDQHTALTWVHQHIIHFGGDPDQVTLFGESAGSWSLLYHLLSGKSKGLFQRIIGESGSPLSTSWGYIPTEVASRNGELFAEMVDCPLSDLACFQNLSLDTLLNHSTYLDDPTDYSEFKSGNPWNGVLDKDFTDDPFLPDTPLKILENGDFDQSVQLILGANQDEGLYETSVLYFNPDLYAEMSSNWSHYGPVWLLGRTGLGDITEEDKEVAGDILEYYTGSRDTITHDDFFAVTAMKTDAEFWPSIDTTVSILSGHGVQVHHYIFSYRGEHSILDYSGVEPGLYGVSHADELFYLFDPLLHIDLEDMIERDKSIRNLLVSCWASFAKYGDPTPPGSSFTWTPVTGDSRLYLNISGTEPGMERREDYENRIQFWSTLNDQNQTSGTKQFIIEVQLVTLMGLIGLKSWL